MTLEGDVRTRKRCGVRGPTSGERSLRAGPGVALALLFAGGAVAGCDDVASGEDPVQDRHFDLAEPPEDGADWEAGFTDYPEGWGEDMELTAGRDTLPESFSGTGFHLGGTNRSDDLFMFLTRPVEGFEPGAEYRVDLTVRFLSAAPRQCAGIGGPPGESVHMKAGAAGRRPEPVREDGDWRLNVDKGNQLSDGSAAERIGDVATSNEDCREGIWEELENRSEEGRVAMADEDGRIWLLVGTDSGFEGRTVLFYTDVEARFFRR